VGFWATPQESMDNVQCIIPRFNDLLIYRWIPYATSRAVQRLWYSSTSDFFTSFLNSQLHHNTSPPSAVPLLS
jgi:hypothetical protein